MVLLKFLPSMDLSDSKLFYYQDSSDAKDLLDIKADKSCLASIIYHDTFDFPLNSSELYFWKGGKDTCRLIKKPVQISSKDGFYFVKGKNNLVAKRLVRSKISDKKLILAQKYVWLMHLIPTIKTVAVTGALAMKNADEDSDIDLMIISKKGCLWTSRLIVLVLFNLLRFPLRRYGKKKQKDKLCLNIWLDESDLVWKKRNIYTAHEIVQVVPLVNKNNTYEKFIKENCWAKKYWPNAVEICSKQHVVDSKENASKKLIYSMLHATYYILQGIEAIAFKLQYHYMLKKITRETITPTRALFHPYDWSKVVTKRWGER